jgi:hypothetical protein
MSPEFNAVAIARKVEEKLTLEIDLEDLLLIATAIQDGYEAGLKDCLTIADQVVDDLRDGYDVPDPNQLELDFDARN